MKYIWLLDILRENPLPIGDSQEKRVSLGILQIKTFVFRRIQSQKPVSIGNFHRKTFYYRKFSEKPLSYEKFLAVDPYQGSITVIIRYCKILIVKLHLFISTCCASIVIFNSIASSTGLMDREKLTNFSCFLKSYTLNCRFKSCRLTLLYVLDLDFSGIVIKFLPMSNRIYQSLQWLLMGWNYDQRPF